MSINNQAKITSQSLDNFLGNSLTTIIDAVDGVKKYFFKIKMNKKYENFNENKTHFYMIDNKKINLDDLYYGQRAESQQSTDSNYNGNKVKAIPANYEKLKQVWE